MLTSEAAANPKFDSLKSCWSLKPPILKLALPNILRNNSSGSTEEWNPWKPPTQDLGYY